MFHYEIDRQSEIDELLADAKAAKGRLRALVNKADAEKRDLTPAEAEQVDRLGQQADAALDRADVLAKEIRDGASPTATQSQGRLIPPQFGQGPKPTQQPTFTSSGTTSPATLFGKSNDTHGFRDFAEFMQAVRTGRDSRLRNAFEEGTASAGGFAVPPGYSQQLLQASIAESTFAKYARIVPMSTPQLSMPAWDDLTRSSTLGGLAPVWVGEAATNTDQTGTLREVNLVAKKLAVFCKASSELAADVPNFGAELARQMTNSLTWALDHACINGTGAGQPLGILNHASKIAATKENAQSGTLTANNLFAMAGRLAPQCWKNAIWLLHPSTLPTLFALSQSSGPYSGEPAVRLADAGGLTIMGRPVVVSEHCQTLATAGDAILVDPTQYLLGVRREISVEINLAPGWATDQVSYRAILRADGQSSWDKAMTPKNGSTTLSWAVVVETR